MPILSNINNVTDLSTRIFVSKSLNSPRFRQGRLRFAAAKERIDISAANAQQSFAERKSAQKARQVSQRASGQTRANLQARAAGLRAQFAATASSRLLTEFEAGRSQKQALQQRQQDTAIGRSAAQFGTSGISSIGAQLEAKRQNVLQGNVQASADNSQKEQILNQARQAITGAFAGGVSAAASGSSASAFGQIFRRRTATKNANFFPLITVKSPFGTKFF